MRLEETLQRWRSMTAVAIARCMYNILYGIPQPRSFTRQPYQVDSIWGHCMEQWPYQHYWSRSMASTELVRALDRWKPKYFSLRNGMGAEVNDCMNSIGIWHCLTYLTPRSTGPMVESDTWVALTPQGVGQPKCGIYAAVNMRSN